MTMFEQGFIDKCAASGVDPSAALKSLDVYGLDKEARITAFELATALGLAGGAAYGGSKLVNFIKNKMKDKPILETRLA